MFAAGLKGEGEDCKEKPCGARYVVWPGNMLFDEANNRVLVFYNLIYAEPGDFNFEGIGSSIAVWNDPDERPVRNRPGIPQAGGWRRR